MIKILLPFVLLAITCSAVAQVFSNLDFEYGVYKAQPRKWAIEGEGEYDARLDTLLSKRGTKSLFVTLQNAQVFIYLALPRELIAGKTIQVQGYVKSSSADLLQAVLIFHNPNGGRPIASQGINAKNNEWQMISHQASFPADYSSDRLLFALMANGTGNFWFDNVKISIDGIEYGIGAPDFRAPTKKEIKMLDKNAIPIKSLEATLSNKDLLSLRDIIGDSRIVALGENSHGSASIYKLKLRMIKYLVEQEGFSIFALETPTVEADRINEYVLHGRGTKEDVLKDLIYPSWQTQEMLDIIEWMKSYNIHAKRKVEFRGFDMQNGLSALDALTDFAKANDSTLTKNLVELSKLFHESKKDDQQRQLTVQKSKEISLYLSSKNYANVERMHLARIRHYMDIFLQSLTFDNQSENSKSRDEYMAENVDWILKNSDGDTKIIVSADNTHVTKSTGKMGHYLKHVYGKQYFVFGFTYNTGSYSAYGPKKYYEVHPSYVGTFEYYFSKSRFKNYFLDLRNEHKTDMLKQPGGFRTIGSRPQETTQFTEITLGSHFDVIAYIEKSVHTQSLTERQGQR